MKYVANYNLDIIKEWFVIDPESPSGITWKKTCYSGKNQTIPMKFAGEPAGAKEYGRKGEPLAWRLTILGNRMQAHRAIWLLHYGSIEDGLVIDHLDGNPFNNKIENLAKKTTRANNQNLKLSVLNKTGVCGVFLENDKNGIPRSYTATWCNTDGFGCRKRFYFSRYKDEEAAFVAAKEFREAVIEELKASGMQYSERHGT